MGREAIASHGHKPTRFSSTDRWNLAIVLALCGATMLQLWTRLHSMMWFDPAWWLQEMFRFAAGQIPYKDYFWPYPPLSVIIFGTALRLFGAKYAVAQIVLDAFSLSVVLGVYFWTRRMFPAKLHALACALVIAVSATSQTYFSLFTFLTYGPSLHVSATGLFMLLLGVLRYLEEGFSRWAKVLIGTGAGIALTSKQEPMVATVAVFALLAIFEWRTVLRDPPGEWPTLSAPGKWMRRYAGMALLWFGPAVVVYAIVAWVAGWHNLLQGIQGNGLARISCPWWPTGIGLFAAVGGLGFALLIAGVTTLVDARRWRTYLGARYAVLLAGALVGGVVYAAFETQIYAGIVFGPDPPVRKLVRLAPELLSTSSVFRPALWAMIGYWLVLMVRAIRSGAALKREQLGLLLVFTIPVSMSLRSLFGTHLMAFPEVPAICYPFVVLLTPYLLLRWLRTPYTFTDGPGPGGLRIEAPPIPVVVTAALMLAYIAVRLIGGYPAILSSRLYSRLETPAGVVHVRDIEVERQILDYVLAQTKPSDPILEIPDGGGMSFATGRPSYSFTTLWTQIPLAEDFQALDLRTLRAHPPQVVIAQHAEHLGSFYGVMGTNGCMFPTIAWVPNRLSWRPGFVFPAVQWIEQNYRVDRQIGEWVLLRPR